MTPLQLRYAHWSISSTEEWGPHPTDTELGGQEEAGVMADTAVWLSHGTGKGPGVPVRCLVYPNPSGLPGHVS